jgi:F0F1-type ATP synthase membrane subunit a
VRLFSNMMAGHILLHIISGFSWFCFLLDNKFSYILFFIILVALMFLETAVCFIQAYVFIILSSLYFKDFFVDHH